MNLTDLIGHNNADWMTNPHRNCNPNTDNPRDIRATADAWHPTERLEDRATKLCDGCPVKRECAAYAIERPEEVGIWGGTTTAQRNQIRAGNNGAAA